MYIMIAIILIIPMKMEEDVNSLNQPVNWLGSQGTRCAYVMGGGGGGGGGRGTK